MKEPKELGLLKKNWLGAWDISIERTLPSGTILHGKGTLEVGELSGGYALHALYRLKVEEMEPHEEHELWGYDQESGKIHMFCVTSRSGIVDLTGEWRNETTMTLTWKGVSEGKSVSREFLFSWVSPDEVRASQKTMIDEKPGPVTTFIMKRAKESV